MEQVKRTYILAQVGLGQEKLGTEVFSCDVFVVEDGDGSYAGQHQVLADLVA